MTEAEGGGRSRDIFWRRLAAGAIDIVLLVILAQAAAVLLYAASDGKLRSSPLLKAVDCRAAATLPAKVLEGVMAPVGARPVAAQVCKVSLMGFEMSRYATVALQAQEGEVTRTMAFSRPVDARGLPVRPVILDWAYPLAFILIVALAEGLLGATPGKRLMGLKVVRPDGGRIGIGRALGRNAVIYGGAALVLIAPLVAATLSIRLPPTAYYGAVGIFGLLILAPLAMLTEAAPRARYDRWTGAEVVKA